MRGVVIIAGGPRYFMNAYINCKMLRHMGCTLPVEWYYLGAEMTPAMLEAAGGIEGVRCIDLGGSGEKTKALGGWQAKIEGILASAFNEILYLDADSFPVVSPEPLFEHPHYRDTGCVLWKDFYTWSEEQRKHLCGVFGVSSLPERQVEAGQMMFNRDKCMRGLLETQKLNRDSEETYKHVYGDKDTFLIGMVKAGVDWRYSPDLPYGAGGGMAHNDFDGNLMFIHLVVGNKWSHRHSRPRLKRANYPLVDAARGYCREAMAVCAMNNSEEAGYVPRSLL